MLLACFHTSPAAHHFQGWGMDIDLEDWEIELKRTKRLCWVQRHHCEHVVSQFPFCPFHLQGCHLGGHGSPSRVYQLVSGKVKEAHDARGETALQGPCVSVSLLCR